MTRTKNTFNAKSTMNKVRAIIGAYADTEAKRMEAEAKANKPWTTRTSNAENSIQGTFDWEGNKCKIVLSGNMEYSVYLELAHEKKYAILKPTIERNAPRILKGYQKLVK